MARKQKPKVGPKAPKRRNFAEGGSAIDTLPVAGEDYTMGSVPAIDTLPVAGRDYTPLGGEPAIDTLPVAGEDYTPLGDEPAIDTLPVAGRDYTIGGMGYIKDRGGSPEGPRQGRGRDRGRRRGFADGGAVDDDTINPGTGAEWTTEAYRAALRRQEMGGEGYANGGVVRTGYADGGTVYDDPSGVPAQPNYDTQAEERRLAEERARLEAEQRAAAEAAAQRQVEAQRRTEPITPPVQGPASGALPEPTERPSLAGQSGTPWYRQVYDSLVNNLQVGDTTGYNAPTGAEIRPDAAALGGSDLVSRLNQPNPLANAKVEETNPYDRWNLEKYGLPGRNFMDAMAETTKGSWVHRMLGGEKSYSLPELNDIQKQDPGRDIGGHLQEKWRAAELKGDQDEAQRIQQTVRNGFNTGTAIGLDRLNNGDLGGATQAIQHSLNMFTDDRKYEVVPTTDGRVQIKITPEKPGMGEPVTKLMSPGQFRDLFSSNGGQFDHLMHNGVAESIDIATGRAKPVDIPGPLHPSEERYRGGVTDSGYPLDSPAGLMERAEVAARRGAVDKEATGYADKARAAVRGGIPPDQVHGWLREGGDPSKLPQREASATPITRDAKGRLVYDPIYDIPGAASPYARNIPTPGLTARAEEFDGSGRYIGGRGRTTGGAPSGRYDSEGNRIDNAVRAEGTSDTTDIGARRRAAPAAQPAAPAAAPQGPLQTGYGYGERRAGYRAPASGEDIISPSWANEQRGQFGPPAPGTPGAQRDIFQTARGAGRFDPSKGPEGTLGREDYNRMLQERQQLYKPPTDTGYQARNRALEQESGYAGYQDRQAAALKQAKADADKDYQARQGEYNRILNKYGYYNQELAAQDKAGTAPPVRYTDDWRHVPRPPTEQEQAQDIAASRAVELTGAKNAYRLPLQTMKDKAAGERVERQQQGAGERATQREEGRNLRAADITADRRAHQHFLESKQTQELLQRRGSDDMKQAMATFRTKLAQGIKPDEAEVENYNTLVDAVMQEGKNRTAAPAAQPNFGHLQAAPEQLATARPVGSATPPGPPRAGYKWQHNPSTGEWRQAPV